MKDINKMNGKELGDYAELQFQMLAFKKGFIISKPFGENSKYDFIIDSQGILARVQVRATNTETGNGIYRISTNHARGKKYTKNEVDYVVGYIVPKDVWYIFPIDTIKGLSSLRIRPDDENDQYIEYKDKWYFSVAENSKLNFQRKGGIYPTKYGFNVRFGRKITRHFKKRKDAEIYLDELNFLPHTNG